MTANRSLALEDVWRDHRQWSRAAGRLKQCIIVWRSVALGLAIPGAVLATLATQVGLTSGAGPVPQPGRSRGLGARSGHSGGKARQGPHRGLQVDGYYRPQAARQQQRLSLFRGIEFTLSVLAALLA